jgi:Xaa-Pro aminopeptidase
VSAIDRIEAVRNELTRHEFVALLVFNAEKRRYLSGFTGEDGGINESAGVLVISTDHLVLATDSRYELQARNEAPLFETICYRKGFTSELASIARKIARGRIGYESSAISHATALKLEREERDSLAKHTLVAVEDLVENLRAVKSEEEIDATEKALAVAEKAFLRMRGDIGCGMTEKEIAWMLEKYLREEGADALSFPVIVAAGPNSALPHAIPTDRPVREGEPVLVDWGARLNGYCSDTTRTFVLGTPDDTYRHVFETVATANRLATAAIRDGAGGTAVDAVARNHIAEMGYRKRFGHSLGHGTGLAVHELPRLSPVSDSDLHAGMLVTVEPGIYLPQWGGVRLENQVVVETQGARVLNRLPMET